MPDRDDELYVGYLPKAPPRTASFVRGVVAAGVLVAIAVAVALVNAQSRFDPGTFEFGIEREIEGIVFARPHPVLLVPGADGSAEPYLLSAFGKHGAGDLVAGLDGRPVRVVGSLIENGRARMLEAHAVEPLDGATAKALAELSRAPLEELGPMTLVGEIVDAKCHLGVMKPGRGTVHAGCAVRCIRGGVPALLRVEDAAGRIDYLELVDRDGRPVGERVVELVAVPVEVTGDVLRRGDQLLLRADPSAYRRAPH